MCFFHKINRTINVKNKKRKKIRTPRTNSLQAQSRIAYVHSRKYCGKSTFLSAPMYNGSVTVEAALALPIFIYAVFFVVYFMIIINSYNIMENTLINVASQDSKTVYALERLEENGNNVAGDISSIITSNGISIGIIESQIISNMSANNNNVNNIVGGLMGLNFYGSSITDDNSEVNVNVSYMIKMPFIGNNYAAMKNVLYFKSWIGKSIKESQINTQKRVVYITRTGYVYHLDKNCTHIKLTVNEVLYSQISYLTNRYSHKYTKCEKCVKSEVNPGERVYITDMGDKYHSDRNCSGIKRDVSAVDISEVGNRKMCTKCGNE